MDFDALLDDSLGDVDYDALERAARPVNTSTKAPSAPAPFRKVTALPVPKGYNLQQQQQRAQPQASSSRTQLTNNYVAPSLTQKTLYGSNASQPIQVKQVTAVPSQAPAQALTKTVAVKVCKTWDRKQWAQLGWGRASKSSKKKGKKRALDEEDEFQESSDEEQVIQVDIEQDPDLIAARAPPMKLVIDKDAAKSWIYPILEGKQVRDYQFNIAHKALFTNVLCSLPTGLGKTFIAAVVMLNFYRCFPQGKIIFVAPTKPLVAQQIEACHMIGGIPNEHSCEMTGQDPGNARAAAWEERRVFYGTPQTVSNDLQKGRLDASKVCLVVIDEAHRATGDYAYCTMVRYMMAKNPHFRLLALTATPGAKSEAVQNVIDNLHIGHIEVRTEESMDIQPHIHQKLQDIRIISLTPDIIDLRDRLIKLIEEPVNRLKSRNYLFGQAIDRIAPFTMVMARQKLTADRDLASNQRGMYYAAINQVSPMLAALESLLTKSIKLFAAKLKDIKEGKGDDDEPSSKKKSSGSGGSSGAKMATSEGFLSLYRLAQQVATATEDSGVHPKMVVLLEDLLAHFGAAKERGEETRVMIFSSHRDMVEELVDFINSKKPLLRAERFVGQGTDTKGRKGFNQKQQLAVIQDFKNGKFNILVATSIGEEGLDIGEVDVIYCYDASKSPIRMLQRVGRTGRARQGKIVVLMSEGREEGNWDKAKDGYAEIQNALVSGKALSLFEDCEQMFPDRKIECVKQELDITKYQKQNIGLSSRANSRKSTTETKRKSSTVKKSVQDLPMMFQKGSEVLEAKQKRKAAKLSAKVDLPKPVPSEAEELNLRKSKAMLSFEEIDEISALNQGWPAAASAAKVTLSSMPSEQRLPPASSSSRFATASAKLNTHLQLGRRLETSEEAAEVYQQSLMPSFRMSDVHWWDADQDLGHGSYKHKPLRPERASVPWPVSLDAVRRERLELDARQLDVHTQFQRACAEAESDLEDAAPANESEDEDDEEMADFIVPDDAPIRLSSKPRKSQQPVPRSPSFSDDDFDSALAQDGFVPELLPHKVISQPKPSSRKASTLSKKASAQSKQSSAASIRLTGFESDDLPELPELDELPGKVCGKVSKPKPAAPKAKAKVKPVVKPVVELLSSDEDKAMASTNRKMVRPQPKRAMKLPPSPSRCTQISIDSDDEPAAPTKRARIEIDSSDEEMSSMPRLPEPVFKKIVKATETPIIPPQPAEAPAFKASRPDCSGDLPDEDEDMFSSFNMNDDDIAMLDAAAAAHSQQAGSQPPLPPSPATIAMPPPPTTSKKRSHAEALDENPDASLDSSAVKPTKARRGPAKGRVIQSSSPSGSAASAGDGPVLKAIPDLEDLKSREAAISKAQEAKAAARRRAQKEGKATKKKTKTRNKFIDNSQAVCSDGSNKDTSDEQMSDDPDTSDREALTDGEMDVNSDMEQFYRDSLLTQHPKNGRAGVAFADRGFQGAAYKMRFNAAADVSFAATQRPSSEPTSDYMDSSFAVGDDVVEYESDDHDALPSDM